MFRMMISPRFWMATMLIVGVIAMLGPLAILLLLFFLGLAAM